MEPPQERRMLEVMMLIDGKSLVIFTNLVAQGIR
jgi:hypothetical protein